MTLGQGNFSIQSVQDGTTYDLKGTTENGEVKLAEVTIEADGKSTKYESMEKVPEEHRAPRREVTQDDRRQTGSPAASQGQGLSTDPRRIEARKPRTHPGLSSL